MSKRWIRDEKINKKYKHMIQIIGSGLFWEHNQIHAPMRHHDYLFSGNEAAIK